MRSSKIIVGLMVLLIVFVLISSTVPADAITNWKKGDEKNYTGGHTFEEEFWVADHENKTKEEYFKEILDEFNLKPKEVLVVGDKIEDEIYFANNLGMYTARVLFGKYKDLKLDYRTEKFWRDVDELYKEYLDRQGRAISSA